MDAPARVSVITAFLNAEGYLEEAIHSVLAQTFREWELLLIDDGSCDGSTELARKYATSYPGRVRYLSHDEHANRGPSASRNLGLEQAVGEYVAILDADDVWEALRLAKQVAFLDSNPDVALVGSWYREMDEQGRVLRTAAKPCSDLDIRWAMLFYCPFLHSTVLFRRRPVLDQVGIYEEALRTSEDYELWQRVIQHFAVANLPEPLVRYRVHDHSLTATIGRTSASRPRVRNGPVSRFLGWESSDRSTTRRLDAMRALLLGWGNHLGPDELHEAGEQIFRLHEAFCASQSVAAVEARRQRDELRRLVARNLVRLALAGGAQDPGSWRPLLTRAWHIYPRHFLRPGVLLKAAILSARGLSRPVSSGG